jgi:hypothetical protein
MGDGVGQLPSALAKADGQAKVNGSEAAADSPSEPCSVKDWTLKVKVRSQHTFWPKTRVTINVSGSGDSDSGRVKMKAVSSTKRTFRGSGKKDYDVSASVDHWDLVATKKVQLKDGATESLELEIKRHPWIAFKVVDEKTNKQIKNVTLKVDVAGPGLHDLAAAEGKAQVDDLGDAVTRGKLHAIEHADAWIWVKEEASDEPIE